MKTYKIASIPGDGVGNEVVREGLRVLEHIAKVDGRFNFEVTFCILTVLTSMHSFTGLILFKSFL